MVNGIQESVRGLIEREVFKENMYATVPSKAMERCD